ncbi:MAG: efflux RND transporter periplasmic adaptor subunit [Terricaulis sp.]
MMGLFKRFGFAAVVVAGLALMLVVVVGKAATDAVFGGDGAAASAPAQGGRGGGGGGRGGGATNVVAVATEMHTFTDGLQAIGTAQARESIVLTPKVADTIRRLRFESGDRVRAGQVLVEMSSVEQAADMAEARASNQAAQEDLRRTQELFNRGFASQARLDTVQAAADAAAARLNAGGSRIADRTIRAPFAGIVGLRLASPGQYVRPGDQIGTLDDTSEIKLDFTVTETQIARITQGVELAARTTAYPDRTFTGVIANVDSRIDPATRTVRVRAILPNQEGTLRPGMLMTVEVRSNPREALAIPEIAILDQIDGAYVYKVAAGENGAHVVELTRIQSLRPGQPVQLGQAQPAAEGALPLRPRGR